jgi:uncharacterized membrane protein YtjA (UPF0391 family)
MGRNRPTIGTRFASPSARAGRPAGRWFWLHGRSTMGLLRWALAFLVIALIAALFGFGNIAAGAADIAKILFFIFIAICIILFILGMTVFRTVSPP